MSSQPSSGFWYPVDWRVRLVTDWAGAWVSLVSLVPLYFLLGSAVPPFGQPPLPDRPRKAVSAQLSASPGTTLMRLAISVSLSDSS
jgi:hypothetical protein